MTLFSDGQTPKVFDSKRIGSLVSDLVDTATVEGVGTIGNLLMDAAECIAVLDERISIMSEGNDEP